MPDENRLETEMAVFRSVVYDLIFGHLGDWIIIVDAEIVAIVPPALDEWGRPRIPHEALGPVYAKYGYRPVLLKEIRRPEDVKPLFINELGWAKQLHEVNQLAEAA